MERKEFGGSCGAFCLILFFPFLLYYMYTGTFFFNGAALYPGSDDTVCSFLYKIKLFLAHNTFPDIKTWVSYWLYLAFEAICYMTLPGVWTQGKRLNHLRGCRLGYYCSGVWSFYATISLAMLLHVTNIFPLYNLVRYYGQYLSVMVISSFFISIVAYISAILHVSHRPVGSFIYDFFMGVELNPRLFGRLDLKMFSEVRMPWFFLFLITSGAAFLQYEKYNYLTPELAMLVVAHFLYANACCKGEQLIVTSWDIFHEKWGFMLIFWNFAGVPLMYCHCSLYLALHDPIEYQGKRTCTLQTYVYYTLFSSLYIFVYWIWDTANSQKNIYRAKNEGTLVIRRAFPVLPWSEIRQPRSIVTEYGHCIMVDGWFRLARKIHYTCDFYFSVSWALVTGFNSIFPWVYPIFFFLMIIHRTARDIQRCRRKYSAAWKEYELLVPALFVPYFF